MNEEILNERERIEKIINEIFDSETHLKLMKHISRLNHMRERILFRIINPEYVRTERKIKRSYKKRT